MLSTTIRNYRRNLMRIKFEISISGEDFDPAKFMEEYTGALTLVDCVKKSDTNPHTKDCYDYGSVTVGYKDNYLAQYYDEVYEKVFINFFIDNEQLLLKFDYEEIDLFVNVYYKDQCNFEIFDKNSLKILSRWDVSLPISVYHEDKDGNLL